MPSLRIALAASLSLAACTSTYHPEYHPVTVTSYEQHVSGAALGVSQPGPVLSAPAPQPPPPPAPWSAWPSE
jgi:hypothetical protein